MVETYTLGNLVLFRHGQSAWNQANQFTGWIDGDLTSQGIEEARRAGRFLRESGAEFDDLACHCAARMWVIRLCGTCGCGGRRESCPGQRPKLILDSDKLTVIISV